MSRPIRARARSTPGPAVVLALAVAGLVLASGTGYAQTEDLPPPPPGYNPIVPEKLESELDKTEVKHDLINIKWGLAPIFDYTWFGQDQQSIDQVGVQEDAYQTRSGRIMARGTLFNTWSRPWKFLVSFEYRGFDSDPDETWTWTDVYVVIPLPRLGNLTIGKEKEGFSYEIVGDAANLVQVERLMNAFAGTRNIGLKLSNTALGDRATWSIGVFNDWFAQDLGFDESGTQVVARVTGLPFVSTDGRRYLHLCGAWRRNGADQDAIRFKGRPESNVTDYYVDTGSIPASDARQLALELLYNHGPFSLAGEYTEAHVDSFDGSDPVFRGYYAVGSWVLTGEHRPYDKKVGYARRILPTGRWGAFELFARYGLVDLDDKQVRGGYLTKFFAGLNWWANRRIRMTVGYGRASLDKLGVTGHTNQYFTRVQWIY